MDKKKMHVALIAGGKSGEREVSLSGAVGVEKALDPKLFTVSRYDPATDLASLVNDAEKIDVAFILLHGLWGEDGTMQGLLDLLDIPYQGSGVMGSAIAMDKNLSKDLYRMSNLPVAEWEIVEKGREYSPVSIVEKMGLPVVVKPVREGSSLGMTIAEREQDLAEGIATALKHGTQVMVEQFINGREITVGVLGNQDLVALPIVEIIPGDEYTFFDYTAKYKPGASIEVCPAEIDDDIAHRAQKYGIMAHKALHLRGYSRTDMIIAEDGQLYLLETNTIPGMTPTSLFPQAAAEYGLDFPLLLERLIELAIEGRDVEL